MSIQEPQSPKGPHSPKEPSSPKERSSIEAAFPTRPLTLTPRLYADPAWLMIIFIAAFFGLAALIFHLLGLPLITDTLIGDAFQPLPRIEMRASGDCVSELLIRWCSFDLKGPDGATRALEFLYLDSRPMALVDFAGGISEDGVLVSIEAQAALFDRWMMMLGFTGLFAGLGIFGVWEARRARRVLRAARSMRATQLRPVEVALLSEEPLTKGRVNFGYRALGGGSKLVVAYTGEFDPMAFRRETEEERGQGAAPQLVALAVVGSDRQAPILLDRRLETLDLTDAERDAIWSAAYPHDERR